MQKEWFESWFDTSYYHILYKNRDYNEAERFVDNLIQFLNPSPSAKFLDIACGKGRHSKFIHEKGFSVTGFDLSEQSIDAAQEMSENGLDFYVHDMRQIFRTNYFDFALNLFTSFGYFKSTRDELNALKSSAKNLKKGGTLVIDFLNREQVIQTLVPEEFKEIDGMRFQINKEVVANHVVKTIRFSDKGQDFEFQEKVKLLAKADFNEYLKAANLKITHTFGNYDLEEFNNNSNRLILVAQKVG